HHARVHGGERRRCVVRGDTRRRCHLRARRACAQECTGRRRDETASDARARWRPMSVVLLVEDDELLRATLRASFRSWDFDVLEAPSGEHALTFGANRHLDLVILDLALPGIDGLMTLRHLRTFTDVPVVVLTVRDTLQDKVAALDAGA